MSPVPQCNTKCSKVSASVTQDSVENCPYSVCTDLVLLQMDSSLLLAYQKGPGLFPVQMNYTHIMLVLGVPRAFTHLDCPRRQLNTWFNTFLWVHVMQRRPTNSLVRLIHTQATNYTLCLHTYFSLSEHNAKWRREYECTRSRRGVGRQSRAQGEKKKKSFQCVVKGIKIIVRKIEGNKINHIFRISCPTRATAGAKECRERNFLPIGNVFPADIIALHWFSLYDINDI